MSFSDREKDSLFALLERQTRLLLIIAYQRGKVHSLHLKVLKEIEEYLDR